MNYLYTIINGYAAGTRNADSLINLLNDCQSKLQTNNPSVPDISVIVYTSSMPDTSIGKLQKIMPGYGPEKDKLNVTIQPVTNGSKPHIRYSDSKYRTTAEYLSTVLNRSNGFRNLNKLVVVPGTEANMKANIEIWLGVVY